MKLDFSSVPLRNAGFSDQPMTILDAAEPKAMLCTIIEIALVETGDHRARERWQRTQLRNLFKHAAGRSSFWRKRLGGKKPSDIKLDALPILTRRELSEQVTTEGPLLQAPDGIPTYEHATSGSSGTPVRFFYSEINGQYNAIRGLAQFFMEGLDISLNRTRVIQGYKQEANGFSVERSESWLGPLSSLFKSGANKEIKYLMPNVDRLIEELKKNDIGYFVCMPRILEMIIASRDLRFLRQAKTQMWITVGEGVSQELVDAFSDLQIPIRSTYSSEEIGPIGFECALHRGHYHIASSNVLVEIGGPSYAIGGAQLGKVLVTHLHSYATPFIRYDLGDLACLRENCPCGHRGPTLYNLQGRLSSVLKHRDGRVSPFHIRGKELTALAEFTEYRMRQTALDKIVLEIGGRTDLADTEIDDLRAFLKQRAGPEFEIEIRPCRVIDWGESRKRHGFKSEIT